MHFPIGMGSYDHHPKYQGVLWTFYKTPFSLDKENSNEFKGGTLKKKAFYRRSINTP
jgi:hypothetical protein